MMNYMNCFKKKHNPKFFNLNDFFVITEKIV